MIKLGKIPVLSLFCGAGGLDLGFLKAGFEPVLAIDNDFAAIESYRLNQNADAARLADLSSLPGAAIVDWLRETPTTIRGVIGGPPCQGFSVGNTSGRRDDPRNELPFSYCAILQALLKEHPLDFFVFENVLGLRAPRHRERLAEIRANFRALGFDLFEAELNAVRFGVAQVRRRLFLVGIRSHRNLQFEWPTGGSRVRTVRETIGDLPDPIIRGDEAAHQFKKIHPNHWTSVPKSERFRTGDFGDGRSFRKLRWDEPSWTVAYGNREIHIHPNGKRRLSIFEAMLLQSFPRSYVLAGNFGQQVTQVSNAVPPLVAKALAKAIHRQLY